MRINKYIAASTDLSRRAADTAIAEGRVTINAKYPQSGQDVTEHDVVTLDGQAITPVVKAVTILFHKPFGFVVSRDGQGSRTIYDLLPPEYQRLNPVGRLDKDSSGLLLLTNDGQLTNQLTHPRYAKAKVYVISLDKPLTAVDQSTINDKGVALEDGLSKLQLNPIGSDRSQWRVTMHEGRNRQIRRTFAALQYRVTALHRTDFGPYSLGDMPKGTIRDV